MEYKHTPPVSTGSRASCCDNKMCETHAAQVLELPWCTVCCFCFFLSFVHFLFRPAPQTPDVHTYVQSSTSVIALSTLLAAFQCSFSAVSWFCDHIRAWYLSTSAESARTLGVLDVDGYNRRNDF